MQEAMTDAVSPTTTSPHASPATAPPRGVSPDTGHDCSARQPADARAPSPAAENPRSPCGNQPPAEELEVIGGFRVHPFASLFPLLEGEEFDDLVEAIRGEGTVAAVEFHEGLLIDGRNRVLAVEELRRRGVEIDLPMSEWRPRGDQVVEQHIYSVNEHRRHSSEDQRAVRAAMLLPKIREACRKRRAATQFGTAARNTDAPVSAPPGDVPPDRRTAREKYEASSIGQLAKLAKVTRYRAIQAATLHDGVAAGEIDRRVLEDVAAGRKRLRAAVPSAKQTAKSRTAAPQDECHAAAETPVDAAADEPAVTEAEVRRRWELFKKPFAITDHRDLRRIMKHLIAQEQAAFDR